MTLTEKIVDSEADEENMQEENSTDDGRPIYCAVGMLHTFLCIFY